MKCPTCDHEIHKRLVVGHPLSPCVIDGEAHHLTPTEMHILKILSRHMGLLVHGDTLRDITGLRGKSVEVHIHNIRQKILPTKLGIVSNSGPGGGYIMKFVDEG